MKREMMTTKQWAPSVVGILIVVDAGAPIREPQRCSVGEIVEEPGCAGDSEPINVEIDWTE
jgi:hypothetical protein